MSIGERGKHPNEASDDFVKPGLQSTINSPTAAFQRAVMITSEEYIEIQLEGTKQAPY